MDQTIAGAVLERAHNASPKGSLSQAKGQRSNSSFYKRCHMNVKRFHEIFANKWYLLF